MATGSRRIVSTVCRGWSEPYGSWKTIWQVLWNALSRRRPCVRPSTTIPPEQSGLRPESARSTVDLPDPDPPTTTKLSFSARTEEHTPELQSLMHTWYADVCFTKKNKNERDKAKI